MLLHRIQMQDIAPRHAHGLTDARQSPALCRRQVQDELFAQVIDFRAAQMDVSST